LGEYMSVTQSLVILNHKIYHFVFVRLIHIDQLDMVKILLSLLKICPDA
jgi:hypothetical protein